MTYTQLQRRIKHLRTEFQKLKQNRLTETEHAKKVYLEIVEISKALNQFNKQSDTFEYRIDI